jgi:hypothetical protein
MSHPQVLSASSSDSTSDSDCFQDISSPSIFETPSLNKRKRSTVMEVAKKRPKHVCVTFSPCTKTYDGPSMTNLVSHNLYTLLLRGEKITVSDVLEFTKCNLSLSCRVALVLRDCIKRLESKPLDCTVLLLPSGGCGCPVVMKELLPQIVKLYAIVCVAARRTYLYFFKQQKLKNTG